MDEEFARRGQRLDALERQVTALLDEIGGVSTRPDGASIRTRIHKLEGMLAAQEYARTLLDKASEKLEEARRTRDQRFVWVVGGGITLVNAALAVYSAFH